ncbi:MAG: hypothetical protein BGO55_24080 [Sphingobacteriales bacterium 50-39]|nr:hypothetical protein [Sphingobacteriales bacterium]OJW58378.1 MAG: hypothetical protein BGO55_24080 [Sphingobacteriales bacterium 50-39]
MIYRDILEEEMKKIGKCFAEDELAYLALTSKVEFPIRDKLAYNLYKRFYEKDIIVSREWRRSDLVLLAGGEPAFICELKAAYTFDIFNYHDYLGLIEKDITKAKSISTSKTEIASLFLTTHVHQIVNNKFKRVIKYDGGINNALKKFDTQLKMIEAAMKIMKDGFSHFYMKEGKIECGRAFEYDVEIYYWIFSEQNLMINNSANNGQNIS